MSKKRSATQTSTKRSAQRIAAQQIAARTKAWRSIDPTVDIVFKKLFGSKKNKNLLIDFLNAVLEFEESAQIQDLSILNPYKRIAARSVISKMISSLLWMSKLKILRIERFRLRFKSQVIKL